MLIEKRGKAYEQKSAIKNLFFMTKSKGALDRYTSVTGTKGFEATGENGAYPVDSMREGYPRIIENITWKNSLTISREMADDSEAMDFQKKPEEFISGYYATREKFGAALFGAAISGKHSATYAKATVSALAADGKTLFHQKHKPLVSGDEQSNIFTDAFSVDALGALECEMQNFRGDNNDILDVAPDTILIPNIYSLKREVFAAVGADKDPTTANNGFNYQFGRWNIIVWNYLNQFITAGTRPWILLDSNYNNLYGGAVWQDRTELEVKSTIDDNTDANVWRGYARFNAGFVDWRFAALGGAAAGSTLL
ncbi:MAG: hypothetical protein E7549_00415 [Ruminococcaceae bacterium]|nr:hypothetical protein [Oscillospiraceae bacterium]